MSKTKSKVVIGEDFCFSNQIYSIQNTHAALGYYAEHKCDPSSWLKPDNKTPLFFDTNVLLSLYRMSINDRTSLLRFVNKNKNRIFIPAQVEKEFLRHRISHIEKFKAKVDGITTSFKTIKKEILSGYEKNLEHLHSFKDQRMIVGDMHELLEDINDLTKLYEKCNIPKTKLRQLTQNVEKLEKKLQETIDKTYSAQSNWQFDDPILKGIAQTNILTSLSEEERNFLHTRYEQLLDEYDKVKSTDKKNQSAFPGCGDRSKREEGLDPCGDFYIFHEIMAYMKVNDTDAILLTNDVTKEDWIEKDEKPFFQYIVNAYQLTGHCLYIIKADKYLSQPESSSESADEDDIEELELKPSSDSIQNADGNSEGKESVYVSSYYKDITEEEMMIELALRLQLSKYYYDGYVGENYFIYKVLANQNYNYHSSKRLLDRLVSEGKIIRQPATVKDHTFDALSFPTEEK